MKARHALTDDLQQLPGLSAALKRSGNRRDAKRAPKVRRMRKLR